MMKGRNDHAFLLGKRDSITPRYRYASLQLIMIRSRLPYPRLILIDRDATVIAEDQHRNENEKN